ncbi:MAG: GtrA family protein [Lapillicoccus sp.]
MSAPARSLSPVDRLRGVVDLFWREIAKFGAIGAVGLIIDTGLFNLLLLTVLDGKPTTAKIISGTVATLWAWIGNRMWTFRHRRNRPAHHEAALFFLVNGVGLAISTGYLAFMTYVFHQNSHLALNINNIIGIGIATILRFWAYRRFVFVGELPDDADTAQPAH